MQWPKDVLGECREIEYVASVLDPRKKNWVCQVLLFANVWSRASFSDINNVKKIIVEKLFDEYKKRLQP